MTQVANRSADAPRGVRAIEPARSPAVQLCDILLSGLQALADAGQAEQACRLAGRACAALRAVDSAQWGRFNVLLHRLARRTGPVGAGNAEPARAGTT